MLLQDLVDADLEGFVVEALADEILVDPELGRRHRLALGDPREVEPELSVVAALVVELSVMLHWNRKQPIRHLLCSLPLASKHPRSCHNREGRQYLMAASRGLLRSLQHRGSTCLYLGYYGHLCVYQAPFGAVSQLAGTGGHCVLMIFGSFVPDK